VLRVHRGLGLQRPDAEHRAEPRGRRARRHQRALSRHLERVLFLLSQLQRLRGPDRLRPRPQARARPGRALGELRRSDVDLQPAARPALLRRFAPQDDRRCGLAPLRRLGPLSQQRLCLSSKVWAVSDSQCACARHLARCCRHTLRARSSRLRRLSASHGQSLGTGRYRVERWEPGRRLALRRTRTSAAHSRLSSA
jgi:hypothetical protein